VLGSEGAAEVGRIDRSETLGWDDKEQRGRMLQESRKTGSRQPLGQTAPSG